MKGLTLLEYVKSIDQLKGALKYEPIRIIEYEMIKYAKISIGESVNVRDMFILKPGDYIKVKWMYSKIDMICLKMIINDKDYPVYWKNEKIKKWLDKNTKEM